MHTALSPRPRPGISKYLFISGLFLLFKRVQAREARLRDQLYVIAVFDKSFGFLNAGARV